MTSQPNTVSSIDLGLPLEAQVLSQFFDQDFVPFDYINALISISLKNSTNPSSSINNKTNELHSSTSLKLLYQRLNGLNLHFNEYNNELIKRFDQSYNKLISTSSQIISYGNDDGNGNYENDVATKNNDEIITRLKYHLATLNSSMFSLLEDLQNTKNNLNLINNNNDVDNEDAKAIKNLKDLNLIKLRMNQVKSSFELLKSLIASSEENKTTSSSTSSSTSASSSHNNITVEEFKNSITVLQDLMNEQLTNEINIFNSNKDIKINEKLTKIIDNMINLQPIFKSFVHFQTTYSTFVEFLKFQKDNYLKLFEQQQEGGIKGT